MHPALAQGIWGILCVSEKSLLSATMSLLGVPEFSPFPPVLDFVHFDTDTTDWNQTEPVRDSAQGVDRLAIWPIRLQTQVRSPSSASTSVASTHPSIFLPERAVFQLESDATFAASEDLDLPRHSGASNSSRHTAASTVPTLLKLGPVGTSSRKVAADVDPETIVPSVFESVSWWEERSRL